MTRQPVLWDLRNICSNPARLIPREQVGGRAPAGLVLENRRRRSALVAIAHNEAGVGFVDGPGRREAARWCARGHGTASRGGRADRRLRGSGFADVRSGRPSSI
jgi:hypothetical protein